MFKISTRLTLLYTTATGVVILLIGFITYYIYESERRQAIDVDLKDYSDFLMQGLGKETSNDLTEVFERIISKKDKSSLKLKFHRFMLASNDSIIFESGPFSNIDSIINILEDKNEFSFKSQYNSLIANNSEYRTFANPLKLTSGENYQLIVFTSLDRLYESLAVLQKLFFLI